MWRVKSVRYARFRRRSLSSEAGICFGFEFGEARGLESVERGEVLLQVAVDALLIEGEELELASISA